MNAKLGKGSGILQSGSSDHSLKEERETQYQMDQINSWEQGRQVFVFGYHYKYQGKTLYLHTKTLAIAPTHQPFEKDIKHSDVR